LFSPLSALKVIFTLKILNAVRLRMCSTGKARLHNFFIRKARLPSRAARFALVEAEASLFLNPLHEFDEFPFILLSLLPTHAELRRIESGEKNPHSSIPEAKRNFKHQAIDSLSDQLMDYSRIICAN
jgi:hypothetical protein